MGKRPFPVARDLRANLGLLGLRAQLLGERFFPVAPDWRVRWGFCFYGTAEAVPFPRSPRYAALVLRNFPTLNVANYPPLMGHSGISRLGSCRADPSMPMHARSLAALEQTRGFEMTCAGGCQSVAPVRA